MDRRQPLVSLIVPAHNEEGTISRCLDALLGDGAAQDEIIVAANGCTDRTVAEARRYPVTVLDLEEPGKAAALNAADSAASGGIRLYVDADVVLDRSSAAALVAALREDEPRLVTPRRELDLQGARPLVRLYYRTWERLQAVRGDTLGSGVYGVNATGRARWRAFPAGIADDYHVHSRFQLSERHTVPGAVSVVRPPRSLGSLLAVRARVYAGNLDHQAEHGALERPSRRLRHLLIDPVALLGLPVYTGVTLLAKRRARVRRAAGIADWAQDASGRSA